MRFTLNGRDVRYDGHPLARLLDVVREDFALTGTKEGCGEGECGACTVLVDDLPVNACLVPVMQVEGARVVTIEGLVGGERLQAAFVTEGGAQCGICTPGMVLAASVVAAGTDLAELREALAGNLCRCTGYEGVYRACRAAGATGTTSPAKEP
jgi:carbon-monoxide dehydrogenase small subunit/xanthine dehydrogenase small subunit